RLAWADVRPLLEQLTDELSTAQADGSLPDVLSTDQVWVQPDGRVCLLDFPLFPSSSPPAVLDDVEPGLSLVRDTAILALEGHSRQKQDRERRVRAPLPPSAAELLQRLLRGEPLGRFRHDLTALREQPARVTPAIRLVHLAAVTLLLLVGLIFMFLAPIGMFTERSLAPLRTADLAGALARGWKAEAAATAAALVRPCPWAAAGTLEHLRANLTRSQMLEEVALRSRQMHDAYLRCMSWSTRQVVRLNLRDPVEA